MKILQCSFRSADIDQLAARIKWAVRELDPQKMLDVEISTSKTRRSLDANAYCWALIGQIAEATKLKKEEVYRDEIKQMGGNYDTVCVPQKAVDALCRHWQHNGLGWITETFESKLKNCVNVNLYYGSSAYDSKQMSILIDNVVQDAKALGIETKTPQELSLLKEDWGQPDGKK